MSAPSEGTLSGRSIRRLRSRKEHGSVNELDIDDDGDVDVDEDDHETGAQPFIMVYHDLPYSRLKARCYNMQQQCVLDFGHIDSRTSEELPPLRRVRVHRGRGRLLRSCRVRGGIVWAADTGSSVVNLFTQTGDVLKAEGLLQQDIFA